MNTTSPTPSGIVASLRGLADLLLAHARNRVALFAVELEEERQRLIRTLVWISAAIFAGMMALACATLAFVYHFWSTARVEALAGLAAFYLAVLAAIMLRIRRTAGRQPRPFSATLEEIEEDRRCLHPEP